jgi:hypothetical protein
MTARIVTRPLRKRPKRWLRTRTSSLPCNRRQRW